MNKFFVLVIHFLFGFLCAVANPYEDTTNDKTAIKISALPYYSYGKGLGMTSPDSLYQLNIRFRMQNRITYSQNEGEEYTIDGQIRRLRLRFDGFVGNPKFMYSLQLSFAPGDVGEIQEGNNINIIRDAAVFYKPNQRWNFIFGQTKLPGNRQRVNSSGALQFTDRSINNSKFNIDRDFGVQIHQTNMFRNKFSFNLKGAVTMGEGRNWTKQPSNGLAYTGKLELYPLGAFTKEGDFFEGDLMRESRPKILISGAFHHNSSGKRTQGQTGNDLYAPKDMQSILADFMLKYNGWAFMSAYMKRISKDPITYNPVNSNEISYVFTGEGLDVQGSYIFKNNFEVLGRYSIQKAHKDIQELAPNNQQLSLGLSKYIWEHAFKIQSEITYEIQDYANQVTKNNWYARFQIEMGI